MGCSRLPTALPGLAFAPPSLLQLALQPSEFTVLLNACGMHKHLPCKLLL